jgi:hypothetical protein
VLVSSNRSEVLGISLWEQKADAEAYHRTAFPEVQKILSKVVEGTPQVQNYDVSHFTIHKVAAGHACRSAHLFTGGVESSLPFPIACGTLRLRVHGGGFL